MKSNSRSAANRRGQGPKAPPVSIEALRELVVYADCRSVSEAAAILREHQPTVSRRLRQAFAKSKTRREPIINVNGSNELDGLTAAGERILPAVRDLVRQYDRLADAIVGIDDVQQIVRLGVGSFGAEHYVPELLARVQPETKGWLIEVSVCRGQERIVRTARGDLNLAIVTHTREQVAGVLVEAGYRRDDLQIDQLAIHPLSLVAAAKTKFAEQLQRIAENRSLTIADLAMFELVGLDEQSGIRRQLEQWADTAKKPLYFVAGTEAGGWNAARQHMRRRLGAAILPTSMLHADHNGGCISRPLAGELSVCDYLIRRKGETNACCKAVSSALLKMGREWTKEAEERSRHS